MRPMFGDKERSSSSGGRYLNRYNFQQWRREIIDYCEFKGKTSQRQLAAHMRSKLSVTHQRRLRMAMEQETGLREHSTENMDNRKNMLFPDIDCVENPFDWSLKYLQMHIVRMGDENSNRLLEQQKRLEASLQRLTIKDCQFSLSRYYEKFLSIVDQMETIGHIVPDTILAMYFQDGCVQHNDLKLAALDSRRRKDMSYEELFQEFEGILERANQFKTSARGGSGNNDRGNPRTGKANRTLTRFKGKCHHCDKLGHKKDDCWSLHPEKKPGYKPEIQGNGSETGDQQNDQ